MSTFKYLKYFLNDNERKSIPIIGKELLMSFIKWKCIPVHYFTRFAYRNTVDYRAYIPNQKFSKYLRISNKPEFRYLVEDKFVFSAIMNYYQLPHATTLAVGYNGNFSLHYSSLKSETFSISIAILEDLLEKANVEEIFLKRTDGEWGTDSFLINKKNLTEPSITNNILKLKEGYWLIQERIKQHPKIGQINSSSLNSVRIDSLITDKGDIEIFSALLRFGVKGAIVDNATSGGGFVGISSDGFLKKHAQTFFKNGGIKFQHHPDSLIEFNNLEIPYWADILTLVKTTAPLFPQLKAIGWDIAITPTGPIIIEANENYHIGMSEIASGGYYNNRIFRKFFDQIITN